MWNLETEQVVVLDGADGAFVAGLGFTSDGGLLAQSGGKLHRWNLESRQREFVLEDVYRFALSRDGTTLVALHGDLSASLHNLENGSTVGLESHGDTLLAVALTADGRTVVTGGRDRIVRTGPANGDEPHLHYGHRAMVKALAVSPDGSWIASGSRDGTVRLWPMPSGQPFHTLPQEELLDRLRALRSYRRVPSRETMRGFVDEPVPFRGWGTVTEW